MGLDRLHEITASEDFGLKVVMGDFDGLTYNGFWDTFKVILIVWFFFSTSKYILDFFS